MRSASTPGPVIRRVLTGSLLAVLAGPLLATTPSAIADETPPHAGEKYVALGDSFASGPQINPMKTTGPAACARSTKNFPTVLSAGLEGAEFVDATCSGAKLTDLWATQVGAPPQLDAVTEDTTLITFGTLGGNDVGLVGIATKCVIGDCIGTPGDANHQAVEATRDVMTQGIEEAKALAPDATIVMVGYGTYLPPGGCPAVPLEPEEADYLQGLIDELSTVIGEVAEAEDVLFADQRDIPGRLKHTACAPFAKQWIRGVDIGDGTDGALLHPSAAGMRATAEQIARVTGIELPPVGPTHAQLKARAKAAMKTVQFKATCKTGKVKLRASGGKKSISRVVFKVGKHKVSADKKAPYAVTRKAKALRKFTGKPKAVVRVKVESVKLTRTFKAKRPGCLKR